jgi:hypothetical protein
MVVTYDDGKISYSDQSVYVFMHCGVFITVVNYNCKQLKKSSLVFNALNN